MWKLIQKSLKGNNKNKVLKNGQVTTYQIGFSSTAYIQNDIISERYERRSTIVTEIWIYPNGETPSQTIFLCAATIDRLRHGAYKVVLEGKSFRCMKSNTDNKKSSRKKTEKNIVAKGGENR